MFNVSTKFMVLSELYVQDQTNTCTSAILALLATKYELLDWLLVTMSLPFHVLRCCIQ